MRERCRSLLRDAAEEFDLVLIDCAPGISAITECWLRECDWHLIPVKPDILADSGFQYLKNYKHRSPESSFARHLGVVVNMKQAGSEADKTIHELLLANHEMACFPNAIPMIQHIQKSALCSIEERSYHNKCNHRRFAAARFRHSPRRPSSATKASLNRLAAGGPKAALWPVPQQSRRLNFMPSRRRASVNSTTAATCRSGFSASARCRNRDAGARWRPARSPLTFRSSPRISVDVATRFYAGRPKRR